MIPLGFSLAFLFVYGLTLFFLLLKAREVRFHCPPLPSRLSMNSPHSAFLEGMALPRGVEVVLDTILVWGGYRRVRLTSTPWDEGETGFPRGEYQVESHRLVLRDWGGFFHVQWTGEPPSLLRVFPSLDNLRSSSLQGLSRESSKRVSFSYIRDQEHADVRPYSPGDDPRRLNWKMMARHDELFIREGNSVLPRRTSALVLVSPEGVPSGGFGRRKRVSHKEGDLLIKGAGELIEQLLKQEIQVTLQVPGGCYNPGKLGPAGREDLLASIPPEALEEAPLEGRFGEIYYFSTTPATWGVLEGLKRAHPGVRLQIYQGGTDGPQP